MRICYSYQVSSSNHVLAIYVDNNIEMPAVIDLAKYHSKSHVPVAANFFYFNLKVLCILVVITVNIVKIVPKDIAIAPMLIGGELEKTVFSPFRSCTEWQISSQIATGKNKKRNQQKTQTAYTFHPNNLFQ